MEAAGAQDGDAVAEHQRLALVVRDVEHRRAEALLEALELRAHLDPELGVEIGERLVQEECLRPADERASRRDALPLPSRQLGWSPPEQGSAADYGSSLLYSAPRLSPFDAPGTQAEPDVLLDRKVREERVALEDHRDVAIPRGQRRDVTVAEEDTPLGRLLEPRNETQRCALLTFTSIGNRYEGTEPLYSQSTIPLPDSAAGKTIKIRFHFQSDSSSRIPSTRAGGSTT